MSDPGGFALSQYDRLQAFYGRVESKAQVLLALNLGMAGLLALNVDLASLRICESVAAAATVLLQVGAFWNVFGTFYPHLDNTTAHKSLIFFGDIARRSCPDFIHAVKAASDNDIVEDALAQVWRNSEILTAKFRHAKRAFLFTGCAIAPWLVCLMLAAQRGPLKFGSGWRRLAVRP